MKTQRISYADFFRGQALVPLAAAGVGSPFVKADTSAAGTPTVQGVTGGGIRLKHSSTAEVQNLCLYMGDVLPFDIDEIIKVEMVVKCTAALDASSSLAFGLAGARNDAIDNIAQAALFRCIGNNNVVCETDDGTNDNNDIATGQTLVATYKRFVIDFTERRTTQEPPSLSLGRKSNVTFYMGNAYGSLARVAEGTRFDMSNYSGGLQLFAQLQKTANANEDEMTILDMAVEVNVSDLL